MKIQYYFQLLDPYQAWEGTMATRAVPVAYPATLITTLEKGTNRRE